VREAPVPSTPALQAVGVDEWAWRKGHRYGTILVDLASHRVNACGRSPTRISVLTGYWWTEWC
jgi:transposase